MPCPAPCCAYIILSGLSLKTSEGYSIPEELICAAVIKGISGFSVKLKGQFHLSTATLDFLGSTTICGEWTENDIISDTLDEDNEEEIEGQQIQSTITNKEATLALETLRKYIEGNEGMEDLFKPLGILENRIENNVGKKQVLSIMSFDTSWDVAVCKNVFETLDQWQFREAFLMVNKHKYPRDQLLVFSDIFMNIEFKNCRYSKLTRDLIESLSKSFVAHLRTILNLPKISATNAAESEDNGNAHKETPWDQNYILPSFMLLVNNHIRQNQYEILKQSCSFSGIPRPEIKNEHISEDHFRARLYIQDKLIAVGDADEKEFASSYAWNNVKEYNQPPTTLLDVMDDSRIDTSNYLMHHSKISENKVGNMILKKMGWKEGDGLGKYNQGVTISPIETIHFKKRFGLDMANYDTNTNINRTHLIDFNIQVEKYVMMFLYGPKKKNFICN
ncbi:uncharacterized protein LOC115033230 [Acyrthosiphon pisum]|uniref:G-patch domain-containing protein n=1 Tax=Acyrthosiphon pisum TaxID=7029 RepID=A0A8R2NJI8_ACYPI|nr:uncharacterized protein LOC115033230 [Acyrthosiphon pisum]